MGFKGLEANDAFDGFSTCSARVARVSRRGAHACMWPKTVVGSRPSIVEQLVPDLKEQRDQIPHPAYA